MKINRILNKVLKSENRKAEILRFAITGSLATLIQYVLYILFLSILAISAVISTIISYILSFICNYFLSNLFTFHTRPSNKNAVAFMACHAVNLGLQTALVAIFSKLINPEFALIPAITICVPCNYLLVRFALKSKYFTQ